MDRAATRLNRGTTCVAPALFLLLAACSRASLLGGPGPEVEHHASPAAIERLAVAEPVKTFDDGEACRARLAALAGEHGGEVVQISGIEYRAYASEPWGEGEVHHEYACVGKELTERSWSSHGEGADASHGDEAH